MKKIQRATNSSLDKGKLQFGRLQTAKIVYPFFPTPFASANANPFMNFRHLFIQYFTLR